MSFIISIAPLRCWTVVILLAGLCSSKGANASADSNFHEVILGPSFASSGLRSYGLVAGIKNRPRENIDLAYGAFVGGYTGDQRFLTTDVTFGVGITEGITLYLGTGLRLKARQEGSPFQLTLGSSVGYISAELRRYETATGPVLEGAISFDVPLRLFF